VRLLAAVVLSREEPLDCLVVERRRRRKIKALFSIFGKNLLDEKIDQKRMVQYFDTICLKKS
jgi:hypothetical protein